MSERSEATEQHAVRDAVPLYRVAPPDTPPDDVPPGFKRTEIGVIPKDWKITSIRDVSTVATGSTPPTSDPSNYEGDLPFVTPADIGEAKYIRNTLRSLSRKGAALARIFPCNSILFVSIGSTIGKCSMAPMELASNQQINAVLPSDGICPDYWYYAISLASIRIKEWAGTQAVPIVNKSQFSATLLPLPGEEEQRAIATALSDADALIESLDRLIAKKRGIKQAAMQQLLTGETRLPGFEGPWHPAKFGDITSPSKGRLDPTQSGQCSFCVELEHVEQDTGRLLDWSETNSQSSLKATFESGDVLFGKLRAYLRKYWLADRPGVCSTEFWVLKPRTPWITSGYLYQLVTTNWFIEAASTAYGTHMPRSDWKVVREQELLVPSLYEQERIVQVLADMDAEIDTLERRRDKAQQVKRGMMQQLLTGRVRLPLDKYEDVA